MRLAWGLAGQTLASVWRHKLRSFLTMFGIAWGIASLVLMSALCDGFRQGQRKNQSQLGDNIVLVFGGRTEKQAGGQRAGRRVRLEQRDVEAIREQCPAVSVVESELKRQAAVTSDYNAGSFLTLGVTPEYLQLRNLPAAAGRDVSAHDQANGHRVCILGHTVRKQLFEGRQDVLGRRVSINGYPYTVAGLMSEKNQNSSYDGWDNDKILIPQSSLLRDCPPANPDWRPGQVNAIIYRPVSVGRWREAQHQVRAVLGRLHAFDPGDEGAIPLNDSIESAEFFDRVFDATEVFLAVLSLVTLSLGGVGVMNTMMTAVAERTHEIGLRKALGATRRRIMTEFLLEGLLLAVASGLAGFGVVSLLASAVNHLPMPTMFSGLPVRYRTAGLALAALGTVAVLSAFPPAWRACRLTPVEALREER
ncbi:MAG: ABC transporter permease [Bryobacterales bacterium]|nr:ABC transporter permease [Bryobacterales bacterium]